MKRWCRWQGRRRQNERAVNHPLIRHLTLADYTVMPWANGLGQTTQMVRVEADGGLLWRLSMASVVADGAFSIFPGIERNLTVLEGPGFALRGEGVALACRPLQPMAFAGDRAIEAHDVGLPSVDFNVMTARVLPRPTVRVITQPMEARPPRAGLLCVLALGPARAGALVLGRHDLVVSQVPLRISGAAVIAVQIRPGTGQTERHLWHPTLEA